MLRFASCAHNWRRDKKKKTRCFSLSPPLLILRPDGARAGPNEGSRLRRRRRESGPQLGSCLFSIAVGPVNTPRPTTPPVRNRKDTQASKGRGARGHVKRGRGRQVCDRRGGCRVGCQPQWWWWCARISSAVGITATTRGSAGIRANVAALFWQPRRKPAGVASDEK